MATGKLTYTLSQLEKSFPKNAKIREPRPIQRQSMAALAEEMYLQELPTGTGKTALEYMILAASLPRLEERETAFWIFPTKALVEQVKREHPDVNEVFGQNEHVCPWAAEEFELEPKKPVTALDLPLLAQNRDIPRVSEIPRVVCAGCPHHVDQQTGETNETGVVSCPFYRQTYEAKHGRGIIAATMSFYVFAKLFSGGPKRESIHDTAYGRVAVLVIDEVDTFADVIRYTLSYDVTDWHLQKAVDLLKRINAPEWRSLRKFLKALKRIAKARDRQPLEEHLLTDDEIRRLIAILEEIDPSVLDPNRIREARAAGLLDPKADWREIKTIETLARDIKRYIHNFEHMLTEEDEEGNVTKRPLNYSCSYYKRELEEGQRVQHKLVLHCHYVASLIRRRLKAPTTVSFSATVGRPDNFAYETGFRERLFSAPSTFPIANRRVYMPADVHNLSRDADNTGRNKTRTLRDIAKGCRHLAEEDIRSLVVVISNDERLRFLRMAAEEGVDALTYTDEVSAKRAALQFKEGAGQVLVGCSAHYGRGVDFPKGIAGAIWFLRPGYPNPQSAATQFEMERYGKGYWGRHIAKVMLQAQQVVGRNIRGPRDRGVCFLMSSSFQDFVHQGFPDWLKPAYRRGLMLEECLEDTLELLGSTVATK